MGALTRADKGDHPIKTGTQVIGNPRRLGDAIAKSGIEAARPRAMMFFAQHLGRSQ